MSQTGQQSATLGPQSPPVTPTQPQLAALQAFFGHLSQEQYLLLLRQLAEHNDNPVYAALNRAYMDFHYTASGPPQGPRGPEIPSIQIITPTSASSPPPNSNTPPPNRPPLGHDPHPPSPNADRLEGHGPGCLCILCPNGQRLVAFLRSVNASANVNQSRSDIPQAAAPPESFHPSPFIPPGVDRVLVAPASGIPVCAWPNPHSPGTMSGWGTIHGTPGHCSPLHMGTPLCDHAPSITRGCACAAASPMLPQSPWHNHSIHIEPDCPPWARTPVWPETARPIWPLNSPNVWKEAALNSVGCRIPGTFPAERMGHSEAPVRIHPQLLYNADSPMHPTLIWDIIFPPQFARVYGHFLPRQPDLKEKALIPNTKECEIVADHPLLVYWMSFWGPIQVKKDKDDLTVFHILNAIHEYFRKPLETSDKALVAASPGNSERLMVAQQSRAACGPELPAYVMSSDFVRSDLFGDNRCFQGLRPVLFGDGSVKLYLGLSAIPMSGTPRFI